MADPPTNVPLDVPLPLDEPPDMVELLELPELPVDPEGLAEPLEFVLPPIAPPVAADAPVIVVKVEPAVSVVVMTPAAPEPEPEAVVVAVALGTVAETVAVEAVPPLLAARATVDIVRVVVDAIKL